MTLDFSYWNGVDPDQFLADDWDNPSRAWAGAAVRMAIESGSHTMVEVGPGPGVDYLRRFRQSVFDGKLFYTGCEGSSKLCAALRKKYPEANWRNQPLTGLLPRSFDIVYAKAVLEHQPALEPSLSCLLNAAKRFAILIWYRPPADEAISSVQDGVYYQTFRRDEVLGVVARSGWRIVEEMTFSSGNVGWRLESAGMGNAAS